MPSDHVSFADQIRYLSDSSSDEDDSKRNDKDDGERNDKDPANDNISLEPEVMGDLSSQCLPAVPPSVALTQAGLKQKIAIAL
jgi:hypothetical protein